VKPKSAGRRSVDEVLALLTDRDFCADAQRTITEAAEITVQRTTIEERQQQLERLGQKFVDKWGVLPPTTGELLDSDPRRPLTDAMASGHWGLVLLFPCTTNRQVRTAVQQIRSVIRKQHRDAVVARHAQLVRWLGNAGFDDPTIARAVFHRRSGLRRPTEKQANAWTPEPRQQYVYGHYLGLGFTPTQAQQRLTKRIRGSEALASAAIRMATTRYVTRLKQLNEHLAKPIQSESLSHALTMLFRALPDETIVTIKQLVIRVRGALGRAVASPQTTRRRDERPRSLEPMLMGHWGAIPIFPWTTDFNIRAAIKTLRTTMGPPQQQDSRRAPAIRPTPFEPLSDALIALLRAVTDQGNAVRRRALELRTAFLQVTVP
jgi:hypothetical protein